MFRNLVAVLALVELEAADAALGANVDLLWLVVDVYSYHGTCSFLRLALSVCGLFVCLFIDLFSSRLLTWIWRASSYSSLPQSDPRLAGQQAGVDETGEEPGKKTIISCTAVTVAITFTMNLQLRDNV